MRRNRALRWLVPVAVVGLTSLGGLAATGTFTARASSESLPRTTPAALVAAVDAAKTSGFSGTIVTRMSLGLPDLGGLTGSSSEVSMPSLLSGSHTVRIWYGGPERQRIALLGATSEADLFRSGNDIWQWNSVTRVATHIRIDAAHRTAPEPAPIPSGSLAALNPQQLASTLLDAIEPSTKLSVRHGDEVADRPVYELRLTPRDPSTRIGSVRIDVDGATKLPLAVRVYARGSSSPSIDVAFSAITFKMPAASYFEFSPPPGAEVRTVPAQAGPPVPAHPHAITGGTQPHAQARPGTGDRITTSGSAWSTVVEYRGTADQIREVAGPLLHQLRPVSGSWGSGRLLDSPLLCALVTNDGRVFAGAVDPSALYAAAAADR